MLNITIYNSGTTVLVFKSKAISGVRFFENRTNGAGIMFGDGYYHVVPQWFIFDTLFPALRSQQQTLHIEHMLSALMYNFQK